MELDAKSVELELYSVTVEMGVIDLFAPWAKTESPLDPDCET